MGDCEAEAVVGGFDDVHELGESFVNAFQVCFYYFWDLAPKYVGPSEGSFYLVVFIIDHERVPPCSRDVPLGFC